MLVNLNLHVGVTVDATDKNTAKALAARRATLIGIEAGESEILGNFAVTVNAVEVSEVKPRK